MQTLAISISFDYTVNCSYFNDSINYMKTRYTVLDTIVAHYSRFYLFYLHRLFIFVITVFDSMIANYSYKHLPYSSYAIWKACIYDHVILVKSSQSFFLSLVLYSMLYKIHFVPWPSMKYFAGFPTCAKKIRKVFAINFSFMLRDALQNETLAIH